MASFDGAYRSIYGRKLGYTSTGGLASQDSSAAVALFGDGFTQTISTAANLVTNSGLSIVSSDSTSGIAMVMAGPPRKGIEKRIVFNTSATAATLNTNSTLVKFNSTLAFLIGGGSTVLNFDGVATGLSGAISFIGLSTVAWAVTSRTIASSS